MLKPTNVGGTKEALRLACTVRPKPFHFVSTFSVYHATALIDSHEIFQADPLPPCETLHGGAHRTK